MLGNKVKALDRNQIIQGLVKNGKEFRFLPNVMESHWRIFKRERDHKMNEL